MRKEYKVALAGSPNVGKSTLFNVLTGSKQHVGNWPGKTIERYEGMLVHHGKTLRVVDLPGTYSLSAVSDEEVIAREFIVNEKPDVVVVIVNALELQTSLYLALQVMELTDKVVIAVNKIDAAAKRGIHIRVAEISRRLGVPVIETSALRKQGIHDLVERILDVAEGRAATKPLRLRYGGAEYYIKELESVVRTCEALKKYPPRWVAIRLLEGDSDLEARLSKECPGILGEVKKVRAKAEEELGSVAGIIMVSKRYEFITEIYDRCVASERVATPTFTEKLDSIMLHPLLGPLSSLLIMLSLLFGVFSLNTGFPLNIILSYIGMENAASALEEYSIAGLLGMFFDELSSLVLQYIVGMGYPEWFASLIADGVVAGIGGVLSFYPLILMVYVAFGFLEDSGLMARIAVAVDKGARRLGLSGKAVLPIMLGLGCNVPAILGTRVLEEDEERILAMLLAPIVPCQARLFVMLALITAVASNPFVQVSLVLALYLYTLILLMVLSIALRYLLLRGYRPPELLVELPPYHRPSLRVLAWHAWDRSEHFLRKAGTIILGLTLLMWALTNLGFNGLAGSPEESFAYLLGVALTPLGRLMGLGDWRVMFAFEAGFIAKEGMIEALMMATGSQNPIESVRAVIGDIPRALSFAVAAITYTPCIATLAAFYEESRKMKMTVVLVVYEIVVAVLSAILVYNALLLTY